MAQRSTPAEYFSRSVRVQTQEPLKVEYAPAAIQLPELNSSAILVLGILGIVAVAGLIGLFAVIASNQKCR